MIIRHDFGAPGDRFRPVREPSGPADSDAADNAAGEALAHGAAARGLIIGLAGEPLPARRRGWRRMSAEGFLRLSRGAFAALAPETVLSPLIAGAHDALEIARHLRRLGYAGEYRIIAPNLPDYALVRAEIGAVAPRIDCRIISVRGALRLLSAGD